MISICKSLVLAFVCVVNVQSLSLSLPYQNITLPLNKTISKLNKEVFGDYFTIKNQTIMQINLVNTNKNISFVILQVHTHIYNVTLYNNTKVYGSYVSGTNVGLYSSITKTKDIFYISNENNVDLKMYISVHGYTKQDPIPGGANLEFPVPISPFMRVQYVNNVINVDTQPPSDMNSEVIVYQMYLRENDFSENAYFEGIKKMITWDQIQKYGVKLELENTRKVMRRSLSAYPGVGSVYVAVADKKSSAGVYSVYVPSFTYACSPAIDKDCYPYANTLYQIINIAFIGLGIFLCFFGHWYFKTEIFIMGFMAGVIITYLFIFHTPDVYNSVHLSAACLMGLLIGVAWLSFWLYHRKKSIALFLTTLHFGLLCSAILYYRIPSYEPMHQDLFFWIMYSCIGILTALVMILEMELSNMLACSVMGAYATVFALDHYLGSNLKYILINVLRRATINNFKDVLLMPPFQWTECLLTIIWITLSVLGLYNHVRIKEKRTQISQNQEGFRYGAIAGPSTNVTSVPRPTNINEHTPLIP